VADILSIKKEASKMRDVVSFVVTGGCLVISSTFLALSLGIPSKAATRPLESPPGTVVFHGAVCDGSLPFHCDDRDPPASGGQPCRPVTIGFVTYYKKFQSYNSTLYKCRKKGALEIDEEGILPATCAEESKECGIWKVYANSSCTQSAFGIGDE
jgi:hypothetical protein